LIFLFTYLKNAMFRDPINTLQELQQAIEDTIANLGSDMLTMRKNKESRYNGGYNKISREGRRVIE
jgi:hypothetical protein